MSDPAQGGIRAYVRLLRPYQWSKNGLLFLPPVLAHTILGWDEVWSLVWAFISFSLAASAVYVLNDFVDVEADRRHPRKRLRPLASGAVPRNHALPLAGVLSVLAFAAGAGGVSQPFGWVLAGYLTANVAYSFRCKHLPILDVVVLTQMYVLRIVAGGVAAEVTVTDWLLGFSLFQFLSIAFVKRYVELMEAKERGGAEEDRIRGYRLGDRELIRTFGVSAGMLAALVMALYIRSPDVLKLYGAPKLLWGVCSILIFWTGRLWLLAERGAIPDDPVAFALRDKASYWTVGLLAAVIVAAKVLSF